MTMLPTSSSRLAEVIKLANRIAREYELEYVGTEHVLLALEREGRGTAAQVLHKYGASGPRLKAEVEKLIKKQLDETWVFGRLPGTPHFKNVIASAIEQAQKLESREVCTEHVLLALLLEKGCVANKALAALGLTYDMAKKGVVELAGAADRSEG